MKRRIIIRPRAEADLREARDWYEKQRSGLGAQLIAEIAQTMERLEDNPELYPEYYRGFRRVITRRFPYKLFYRLEPNRIVVFRMLHTHRDHPPLLSSER